MWVCIIFFGNLIFTLFSECGKLKFKNLMSNPAVKKYVHYKNSKDK